MRLLSRLGVDFYMLLLLATVALGLLLPARGIAAEALGHVPIWARALRVFPHRAQGQRGGGRAGAGWP
mgnify:CR=1 FL=1